MKILVIFVNILLCLNSGFSIPHSSNELKMIVDVVKSYEKPTAVVAKVCWKPSTIKLNLAKLLANQERPSNIRYLRNNEFVSENSIQKQHIIFLLDIQCENVKNFLNQAGSNKLFSKSFRWLVLGKQGSSNDSVFSEFEDVDILVDSEVIVALETENKNIILRTIYKIKPNSEWNTEFYGTWSNDYGLNKSEDRRLSLVMRRKDIRGDSLTTSVVINDNSTKSDMMGHKKPFLDPVPKSTFRIINPLYEFLNASKVLIFTDTWGYLVNDTWNGMVGDLSRNKADLCGIITFVTKERLDILEYLTHPTPQAAKFVFRQPPLSYQNNLFLLPYTLDVWYCTAAFVIILIFILYINTKWDIKKYKEYDKQKLNETCLPSTWSDISMFVICAISQQGSSHELKGAVGRLVTFLVFLAFLFLYTSYSANIVALLQSTSNQIRTLNDLLNSKLELGLQDVAFNKYYFSPAFASRDPLRKALYETKIAPKGTKPNFMSLEAGVIKLHKEPFAFNMILGSGYRTVAAIFQEHEKCGLLEIDFIPGSKPFLCSRKNSPFNEMFKVGLIRIQEHGLSDRANRLFYAKKPVCSVMGGSFGSVNMVDFYPLLLMLLYGMILAFVMLALEILVHRRQNYGRYRKDRSC